MSDPEVGPFCQKAMGKLMGGGGGGLESLMGGLLGGDGGADEEGSSGNIEDLESCDEEEQAYVQKMQAKGGDSVKRRSSGA